MAITNTDILDDFSINTYSGSVGRKDYEISTTNSSNIGAKTVAFTSNFGMGSFGTVPSSIILRFSDGSVNHDFTAINAGEGGAGSFGTANQFAAGTDRPANHVVDEIVSKLNASSLNISAVATGGNSSESASFTASPTGGATVITVTEDPANGNSGNFGGSSGFCVVTDASSTITVKHKAAPFRFSGASAVFNLRGQTSQNTYKTFLGEQKT